MTFGVRMRGVELGPTQVRLKLPGRVSPFPLFAFGAARLSQRPLDSEDLLTNPIGCRPLRPFLIVAPSSANNLRRRDWWTSGGWLPANAHVDAP